MTIGNINKTCMTSVISTVYFMLEVNEVKLDFHLTISEKDCISLVICETHSPDIPQARSIRSLMIGNVKILFYCTTTFLNIKYLEKSDLNFISCNKCMSLLKL